MAVGARFVLRWLAPARYARSMKERIFPVFSLILLNLAVCLPARAVGVYDRINITTVAVGGLYAIPNDGADDSLQIQAAINNGGNKSLYFPPGTYNFKGILNVTGNRSVRLYGDGPGVSTIIFKTDATHTTAGINVTDMGTNNLNVEGLTLQTDPSSNPAGCGTAINASFASNGGKFHTATIHNVQILGSTKSESSSTYWNNGIHLFKASNAVIDKVEISGRKDITQTGIIWDAPPAVNGQAEATGFQLSNIQVKWCNMALLTDGGVEGIYMTGFDFFSCGRGYPAANLRANPGGGVVQLVNGKVDSYGGGIEVANHFAVKVSNVSFRHTGFPDVASGTMLFIHDGFDAVVTECTFYGVNLNAATQENGILLQNAHSVRLAGNNFSHMLPVSGNCIGLLPGSTVVRITDNLFSNDVRGLISVDPSIPPGEVYKSGNNPPP
jgi:hypothetical protein